MEKRKAEDIKTNSSLLFRREEITTILKQRKKKKRSPFLIIILSSYPKVLENKLIPLLPKNPTPSEKRKENNNDK